MKKLRKLSLMLLEGDQAPKCGSSEEENNGSKSDVLLAMMIMNQ
jgi:hypothetical protein